MSDTHDAGGREPGGGPDPHAAGPSTAGPARRRQLFIAGVGGLLVLGAAAGVFALTGGGTDPTLQATPTEPEAEVEPTPVVESDPVDIEVAADEPADAEPLEEEVDIRDLELAQLPWSTTCTGSEQDLDDPPAEPQPIVLTPPEEAELGWWGHTSPDEDDAHGMATIYGVDVDSVTYGDVTGDGSPDAVVVTTCTRGTHTTAGVEVWTVVDGDPVLLPAVVRLERVIGRITEREVVDGRLRLHTEEIADDSTHHDGFPLRVITDYSFDGRDGWDAEVVSVDEPDPPVDNAVAGIDVDLPGEGWKFEPRSRHTSDLHAHQGMSQVILRSEDVSSIEWELEQQEAMYAEFGYELPAKWYEDVTVPGADRAVRFGSVSPSGDLYTEALVFDIGRHTVALQASYHMFDEDPALSFDAIDALLGSVRVDAETFLRVAPGS